MYLFYKKKVPRSKIKVKCLFCIFDIGNLEKIYFRSDDCISSKKIA